MDAPIRAASGRRQVFHALVVADVAALCDDAVAITFAVPADLAGDFDFAPGQSLTVRREVGGREERRSYSICAPSGAPPRIGVRRIPEGVMSTWLTREVAPGDVIEVATPTGSFTPDLDRGGHHVLIAAGSGITPVLSIMTSLLARTDARVTLLYGNRRSDTVMFAEELSDAKDRHPDRVQLVHVLSREPREAELLSGRLDPERLGRIVARTCDPASIDGWWLCGPHQMVEGARALLTDLGVDAARVHTELFYVDVPPPEPVRADAGPVTGAEVTVRLDGRSTTAVVGRDEMILTGAQRVRPDLPFACRGGVCGTCRAKVIEGAVDMRRNFALEPAEVDAGFVLTCQSVPISEAVTIDYDA